MLWAQLTAVCPVSPIQDLIFPVVVFAKTLLIAYGMRLFKSNECYVFGGMRMGVDKTKKLNYKIVDYFFMNNVFVVGLIRVGVW